jgi:hypothetical protein
MGRDLRLETTGSWRKTPSLRRRRYATERPMSAIFAANAPIAARQSNAANSASAVSQKTVCLSLPLPGRFPENFPEASRMHRAIFFLKERDRARMQERHDDRSLP